MFFTLAGKIPQIDSDNSKRKILKIFIIGSVLYAMLHFYVYSAQKSMLFDNIKKYLYYIMVSDFALAYFLMKNKKDDNQEEKYTPEEIKQIQYQQMCKMQMLHEAQQREQSSDENEQPPQKNLFKKKINSEKKNKEETKNKKEKESKESKEEKESKESNASKKSAKKIKKQSDECSDTCIPVYVK